MPPSISGAYAYTDAEERTSVDSATEIAHTAQLSCRVDSPMASHGESTHQPTDEWIPIEDRGDCDPAWRFAARFWDCVLAAVFMAWHVHISPVNRG